MIKATIKDGKGCDHHARVTPEGQLVTAPISYSKPSFQNMTVDNQAYNIARGKNNLRIVITDMFINADRNVGVNGVTVDLYEASAIDSTTIDKQILQLDIAKQGTLVLSGLNLVTNVGVFLNAKMDDNNVKITVGHYYIPDSAYIRSQVGTE